VARVGLVALLALLVAAPAAQGRSTAGGVTMVARDLPVGGERSPASARTPGRFDMVGLRWRGPGTVRFRTRSVSGRWNAWQAPDHDNPSWVGASDGLQYRARGRVSKLRAYYIWSPVEHEAFRRLSVAGSPPIVSRTAWGADELLRRNQPRYAPAVRLVFVHHTATTNAYTPDQAAAIVRGIDVFHVKARGWNDIGYNFLVDRFGRVYEGRYGGMTRAVIGAHALGFNTGSVGIAVIGNFMTAKPTAAATQSLEKLIAWRLDLAHVDPASTLTYVSGGSERIRRGVKVKLRAVSGHRDTGATSCPGTFLYSQLSRIALVAEQTGLPKLYAPVVRGKIGGPVSFSARLSSALPWTITVGGADGRVVARGTGVGPGVSWSWNSTGFAPGRYTWTMRAGSSALPARGVVGGSSLPPPPVSEFVQGLAVSPAVLSPNGDGFADTATIAYTLTARAAVTASVVDAVGAPVATLFSGQKQSARAISFLVSPGDLPDGRYALVLSAQADDGRTGTATAPFTVDRILSAVTVTPAAVATGGTVTAAFALAADGQVSVTVLGPDGSTAATLFEGPLGAGTFSYAWNGLLGDGTPAPPGHYQVLVAATDTLGTVTQTAAFDIAVAPP
jgi:N-acetylmuramoyl-L-alanine amidase/FlgD Ig-like domain